MGADYSDSAIRAMDMQVLLRWARQHGVAVIPKSRSAERIGQNRQLSGFTLSATEMAALDGLDQGDDGRLCWRNDPLRMLEFD